MIRPDGTTRITSGDETVETRIDVSDRPDPRGAYRWDDKVVKSNGKRDCGGSRTRGGKGATNDLRFDAAADRMALCRDGALRECIGPYMRTKTHAAGSTGL